MRRFRINALILQKKVQQIKEPEILDQLMEELFEEKRSAAWKWPIWKPLLKRSWR
jgi:hypothetical protein